MGASVCEWNIREILTALAVLAVEASTDWRSSVGSATSDLTASTVIVNVLFQDRQNVCLITLKTAKAAEHLGVVERKAPLISAFRTPPEYLARQHRMPHNEVRGSLVGR